MKVPNRRAALWIALPGLVVCFVAIQGFLLRMLQNDFPWQPVHGTREHYLAVGKAYSQGFTAGFFLCFFLFLSAVGITAWLDRKKKPPVETIPMGPVGLVKNLK